MISSLKKCPSSDSVKLSCSLWCKLSNWSNLSLIGMIGPDRNVKPVLSTVNQYQICHFGLDHGSYQRLRHPWPWHTVGRRPKISWFSWYWRICETSVRFWNPRRMAFWRCSLSVFFEFEWLTFLEFWRETFLETTSEHISSLVGFSNPSFIFF